MFYEVVVQIRRVLKLETWEPEQKEYQITIAQASTKDASTTSTSA